MPRLELRVDERLLERLDGVRGLATRSAWVRDALLDALDSAERTKLPSKKAWADADTGIGHGANAPSPLRGSPAPSLQRHREDS